MLTPGVRYWPNAGRYALRGWPEGGVVHDEADGSLYEVTPVAAELMAMIADHPGGTADQYAQRLLDQSATPTECEQVAALMVTLAEQGFIVQGA